MARFCLARYKKAFSTHMNPARYTEGTAVLLPVLFAFSRETVVELTKTEGLIMKFYACDFFPCFLLLKYKRGDVILFRGMTYTYCALLR